MASARLGCRPAPHRGFATGILARLAAFLMHDAARRRHCCYLQLTNATARQALVCPYSLALRSSFLRSKPAACITLPSSNTQIPLRPRDKVIRHRLIICSAQQPPRDCPASWRQILHIPTETTGSPDYDHHARSPVLSGAPVLCNLLVSCSERRSHSARLLET